MKIVGTISQFIWFCAFLVALFTAIEFMTANPQSAPQQAALGALTGARVVIAYVFARSFNRMFTMRK